MEEPKRPSPILRYSTQEDLNGTERVPQLLNEIHPAPSPVTEAAVGIEHSEPKATV